MKSYCKIQFNSNSRKYFSSNFFLSTNYLEKEICNHFAVKKAKTFIRKSFIYNKFTRFSFFLLRFINLYKNGKNHWNKQLIKPFQKYKEN